MNIYTVDAFAKSPFTGNQAAVVLLDAEHDASWMQDLAKEINYSETAFLLPSGEGYGLRWFTPGYEVDLCGHATLASAHVLWNEEGVDSSSLKFMTRSGQLIAEQVDSGIQLNFPSTPATECPPDSGLLEALGVAKSPVFCGASRFDSLVVLNSAQSVRDLRPDFVALAKIDTRGIIVTAQSDSQEFDFISRFFAPTAGINEDPVTGSAHCCLAPYWAQHLNKTEMNAYQASERGGAVRVRLSEDRVMLIGTAVTIVRGELATLN